MQTPPHSSSHTSTSSDSFFRPRLQVNKHHRPGAMMCTAQMPQTTGKSYPCGADKPIPEIGRDHAPFWQAVPHAAQRAFVPVDVVPRLPQGIRRIRPVHHTDRQNLRWQTLKPAASGMWTNCIGTLLNHQMPGSLHNSRCGPAAVNVWCRKLCSTMRARVAVHARRVAGDEGWHAMSQYRQCAGAAWLCSAALLIQHQHSNRNLVAIPQAEGPGPEPHKRGGWTSSCWQQCKGSKPCWKSHLEVELSIGRLPPAEHAAKAVAAAVGGHFGSWLAPRHHFRLALCHLQLRNK